MRSILAIAAAVAAVLVVGFAMLDSMSDPTTVDPNPARGPDSQDGDPLVPAPGVVANRYKEEALGGIVEDLAGNPLADAAVTVHPWDEDTGLDKPRDAATATVGTDEKGRFGVPDAPSGGYVLMATRTGYAPEYQILRTFVEDEKVRVRFRLRRLRDIVGKVVTVSGEPIRGATLALVPSVVRTAFFRRARRLGRLVPTARRETESGESGDFRLSRLPPGAYDITVVAAGMVPRNLHTVHAPSQDLEIILRRGQTLTGTITWGDDLAPRSITVKTEPKGPSAVVTLKKNGATFVIEGMAPGTYDVTAFGRGTSAPRRRVRLSEGKAPPVVDLEFESGTVMEGSVLDRDSGRGIPGAEVEFERDGVVQSGVTDANGNYRVLLAPGEWTGNATKDNYHDPSRIRGEPGERLVVGSGTGRRDFRLRGSASIVGRVLFPDGAPGTATIVVVSATPMPGADRSRSPLPSHPGGARTNAGGSFRIDGAVTWAVYKLKAVGPGKDNIAILEDVAFAEGETLVEVPDMVVRRPPIGRPETDPARGTVRGLVKDEDGRPVPGAIVTIGDRPGTAGPDGRYEIPGLLRGRRTARAVATGYAPTTFDKIRVNAGETVETPPLVLPRHGALVAIRVLDTEAQPIPYALIGIRFEGIRDDFPMRCDAFGRAEIEGPSAYRGGLVTIKAEGVGFAPSAVTEGVVTERVVDVVLERFAMLFGSLRASGTAPRTLLVQYRRHDAEPWRSAQALVGREGREFVSDEIPPGRYSVRISATGFARSELGRRQFHAGKTTNVGVVHLGEGGTIRGQVYIGNRKVSPGLRVELPGLGRTTQTDRKGQFVLKNIPAGTWVIWAFPPRSNTSAGSATVTVKDGAEAKVTVRVDG